MKIVYTNPKNIRKETIQLLTQIIGVIEEYEADGYKLTLRQLYYQLVAAEILANSKTNYGRLSKILKDARMSGQVDWDSIEDRTREAQRPNEWENIQEIAEAAARGYRKERHVDQDNYIEVWIEKEALSGVLLPITEKYHVHLMANKGYSSVTAMHAAAQRFEAQVENGKNPIILYLGDHDPSGLDMDRDIRDRLLDFRVDVDVQRIALTQQQIKRYKLPPNPAKVDDPRATKYTAEFGKVSWELDALKPNVLSRLVITELEDLINMENYNTIVDEENQERQQLLDLADTIE